MMHTRKVVQAMLNGMEDKTAIFGELFTNYVLDLNEERLDDEVKKVVKLLRPFFF